MHEDPGHVLGVPFLNLLENLTGSHAIGSLKVEELDEGHLGVLGPHPNVVRPELDVCGRQRLARSARLARTLAGEISASEAASTTSHQPDRKSDDQLST